MPNRTIKESVRSSATLAALSDRAERFFHRLITVADDFGRFEADLELLLAECFPRFIARGWTPETLRDPFDELVSNDLLRTYVVDGKVYAFFVTFEKHNGRRAKWSKFPAPPDEACNHVQAGASTCEQVHAYVPENRESRIENREARSAPQRAPKPAPASAPRGVPDPGPRPKPPDPEPTEEWQAEVDRLRAALSRHSRRKAVDLDAELRLAASRQGDYAGIPRDAIRSALTRGLAHLLAAVAAPSEDGSAPPGVTHWGRYLRHVVLAEAQNGAASVVQEQAEQHREDLDAAAVALLGSAGRRST